MSERVTQPRIGVCSWSLLPAHPDDLLAKLRAVDLTAVQIALSPAANDPAIWGDIVPQLQQHNIAILSGMMATKGEDYTSLESIARTGGVRPDNTWDDNRAHADAVAQLAAQWQINLVTFHAGFIPENTSDPDYRTMLDRMRVIADQFAARGIQLGLETGQETAEALEDFMGALERPNVGVNFDPANMILYGKGDPIIALRHLGPWIKQIHIKDALPSDTPGEWGTEVPVGDGAVDWPAFFATTASLEREIHFVIEREAGDDRIADVRRAEEVIRASTRATTDS